jgi:radical SAM-linked protein
MPKINFADTLPMGMQSQDEQMGLVLTESIDPAELVRRLQEELPDGLDVTGAWRDGGKNVGKHQTYHHYRVDLVDGLFRDSDFQWFLEQQCATIERRNKKGKRVVIDLKKAVIDLTRMSSKQMFMTLGTDNRMTIRPSVVMKAVFGLTDRQIQTATITKRKTEHV